MVEFIDGKRLQEGEDLQKIVELRGFAAQSGLTALAGGGRPNATELINGMNEVTVVATDDDSVLLPAALAGAMVLLTNADAGQDIVVFGRGSDTIDGVAGSTGDTVGEGVSVIYFCPVDGSWYTIAQ